jgi:DNA-binding GntR family transcriptional regulator
MDGSPHVLAHLPLKEEVFQALQQRIIEGRCSPGEWLRQEDIAAQMGVSMTPVREALDLLVAAGLAERVAYRGVRVKQLSHREIAEAYGMRLLLESLASRLAALRISPSGIEELQRLFGEMESQVTLADLPRARELNREFHLSVVRAAGDGMLLRLYSIVSNSFPDWMLYEAMFRHPELLASSLETEGAEHRALLDSLVRRDPEDAARHAVEHILHMGRNLEVLLGVPASELEGQARGILPSLGH